MICRRALPVFIAALLLLAPAALAKEQKELVVFCAASLKGAFGEIGQIYENETGIDVVFNFDGSQLLRTQVENGAYADVFVSANEKQLNALMEEGLMNNGSTCVFARNRPAIIIPKENPAHIQGISDLARPGIKIVIGTRESPIGDYTRAIFSRLANDSAYGQEFIDKVMANVVSTETNVDFIVSKLELGEADAGIAYKSDATLDLAAKITPIEIPERYNIIAEYSVAILQQSGYQEEAEEFIRLVNSGQGAAALQEHGFETVESVDGLRAAA